MEILDTNFSFFLNENSNYIRIVEDDSQMKRCKSRRVKRVHKTVLFYCISSKQPLICFIVIHFLQKSSQILFEIIKVNYSSKLRDLFISKFEFLYYFCLFFQSGVFEKSSYLPAITGLF